jgi:hypothetical protein
MILPWDGLKYLEKRIRISGTRHQLVSLGDALSASEGCTYWISWTTDACNRCKCCGCELDNFKRDRCIRPKPSISFFVRAGSHVYLTLLLVAQVAARTTLESPMPRSQCLTASEHGRRQRPQGECEHGSAGEGLDMLSKPQCATRVLPHLRPSAWRGRSCLLSAVASGPACCMPRLVHAVQRAHS